MGKGDRKSSASVQAPAAEEERGQQSPNDFGSTAEVEPPPKAVHDRLVM